MKNIELYEQMLLIRLFEESLLKLFHEGVLFGTTHTCIGQEAIAVSVINNLSKSDIVISNHRCHGHYIAKTRDLVGLLAEIMGKKGGPCKGRGGSQHIYKKGFFANGIQGNMFPVAAGMAHGEKIKGDGNVVVIFIGDGTFGQGVVYETLNIISLWKIPLLVVVESNSYAQSTHIEQNFAGSFSGKVKGFDISFGEIESNDAEELYVRFRQIVEDIRKKQMPHVEVVHTYRLGPHSTTEYNRSHEEIEEWRKKDPLKILECRLPMAEINKINKNLKSRIETTKKEVMEMPFATLDQ
jgi:TPP-dependent pyruvate/acetoin dehydrogenase alpha subunit